MKSSLDKEGTHSAPKPNGGLLLRRARTADQVERIVSDPAVMKAAYLLPRGESPRAKASSATRRREMADPVKRAEVLARLAASRRTESYREKRKAIKRIRGRWVANPLPVGAKSAPDRSAHSRATLLRLQDPVYRARQLLFLKLARKKRLAALAAAKKAMS